MAKRRTRQQIDADIIKAHLNELAKRFTFKQPKQVEEIQDVCKMNKL
jgi:hypothetical protein